MSSLLYRFSYLRVATGSSGKRKLFSFLINLLWGVVQLYWSEAGSKWMYSAEFRSLSTTRHSMSSLLWRFSRFRVATVSSEKRKLLNFLVNVLWRVAKLYWSVEPLPPPHWHHWIHMSSIWNTSKPVPNGCAVLNTEVSPPLVIQCQVSYEDLSVFV